MKKLRPILAAIIALLFYTVTDILVWQRIFETNQMIEHADTYHTGWFVSLAGYIAIGVILMWNVWKDCLYFVSALLISAFCGLEDVLYYVLDRKPIPDALPWLETNPMIYQVSREGLLSSVMFWILILIVLYIILYEWKGLRRKSIA